MKLAVQESTVAVERRIVTGVLEFFEQTRVDVREIIAVLESGRADEARKKLRELAGRMG